MRCRPPSSPAAWRGRGGFYPPSLWPSLLAAGGGWRQCTTGLNFVTREASAGDVSMTISDACSSRIYRPAAFYARVRLVRAQLDRPTLKIAAPTAIRLCAASWEWPLRDPADWLGWSAYGVRQPGRLWPFRSGCFGLRPAPISTGARQRRMLAAFFSPSEAGPQRFRYGLIDRRSPNRRGHMAAASALAAE